MQNALRLTIFNNALQVSPRQTNQIAQRFVDQFYKFLISKDHEECAALGQDLAEKGLGPKSVLAMTELLRNTCLRDLNTITELSYVAGDFCNSLLEGFILGREAALLDVQERTHRAFILAQEHQKREDRE